MLEIKLKEDPMKALLASSIMLIEKVLTSKIIKKHQVVMPFKKAWDIERVPSVATKYYKNNVFSFPLSSTEERDAVWKKYIWHLNRSLIVIRE